MDLAEKLGLRARVALFFALLGAVTVILLGGSAIWLGTQLDQSAFSKVVTAVAVSLFALLGLIVWVALKFDENLSRPLIAIASDLKTIAHTDGQPVRLGSQGQYLGLLGPASREVAEALETSRTRTQARIDAAIEDAARRKEQMEALLRDLHQGIVIFSLSGRVSLYNQRAVSILHVEEFRAGDASSPPLVVGTLGLGRDIFNIIDQQPFQRAREALLEAANPGDPVPVVFSTCDGSVTMRGHVSLRSAGDGGQQGMVLVFDDVTDELAAGLERDRLLRDATQMLSDALSSDNEDALRDDVMRACRLLDQASRNILSSAWPTSDLRMRRLFRAALSALPQAISATAHDHGHIINGDSATLIALLRKLMTDLVREQEPSELTLTGQARNADRAIVVNAAFDKPPSTGWIETCLRDNADANTAFLSGYAILERHRATLESHIDGTTLVITLDFPSNAPTRRQFAAPATAPRPEFYDFDLFAAPARVEPDTPLSKLQCVVFDCEMTGLNPRGGDEIVSIAGVRVVNGRVLTGEKFDQLVNPGRPIPATSTAIHKITDDMVLDAPRTGPALRAFHSFALDQILVAHNAAFDMAFLTKGERSAGVTFDNTVLDTVLLAGHIQGVTDSLTLDALAERYKVTIPQEARHTAFGDSLATAHVFCQMIRQLEKSGVVTLGDALTVSRAQTALRKRQKSYN
jgi:DNA polymerase-3 subunit epsilon